MPPVPPKLRNRNWGNRKGKRRTRTGCRRQLLTQTRPATAALAEQETAEAAVAATVAAAAAVAAADAAHDGSGESASVPGLLGAHLVVQEDEPAPGPPGPPSVQYYNDYRDCSGDHEEELQAACESWAPHHHRLIDQEVVFHGKVVGCSSKKKNNKTLDVEIWEYGASNVTQHAEATLTVPLRMVIMAYKDQ